MNRFFVPRVQLPVIIGQDAHQIKNVLRLKPGDKIELLDGCGTVYQAEIAEFQRDQVICRITGENKLNSTAKVQVTLLQCLPKAKKMETIIQKCTELGVAKIIPVLSERSIGKEAKPERWQKIAKEAAEQSGRRTVPEITPLQKLSTALHASAGLKIILWELESECSLKSLLKSLTIPHHPSISILIGPEGGLSQSEVSLAKTEGWQTVSLGKNILRTETAGPAVLAMINYEFEL